MGYMYIFYMIMVYNFILGNRNLSLYITISTDSEFLL